MLKLAFLNVKRRKNKSLIAIAVSLITAFIFVVLWSVYSIIQSGITLSNERMGADIIILPNNAKADNMDFIFTGSSQMIYMDKNVIDGKLPMEDIEAITPQFFLKTLPGAGCCSTDQELRIVGIDFKSDFILKPWFKQKKITNFSKNDLILGSKTVNSFDKKTIILNYIFDISGVLFATGTGMDDSVFMNIDKIRFLATKSFTSKTFNNKDVKDIVTAYLIKLKDSANLEKFLKKVESSNINAQVISVSKARLDLKKKLSQFLNILLLFWIAVAFTCFISLVAQFNGMIADRKREIGYLRSIGMKKKEVFRMILLEVGIQGGIGGAIGSLFGVLCVPSVLAQLHNFLTITEGEWTAASGLAHVMGGIILSFIICFAASGIPAMKSARMEPHEAISQGEY